MTIVVAVLVVVGGVGAWLMARGGSQAATPMIVQATSGTVKQTVSASGTVEAAQSADLDFAVPGTVTKVYVAEGDHVAKGQAIARIGDATLVANRDAARASLDAAEEQLTDDEDADASDVQVASDQSAILSAKASLADAEQEVKDAVLRATIAGTVASLDLEVGDVVGGGTSGGSGSSGSSGSSGASGGQGSASSASSSSSPGSGSSSGSPAVTIVSAKHFVVDATVSADDAASLKKGLQAEIAVTGHDGTVYGTVGDVGLVAQTSSTGAAVFPVTIEVTGDQTDLYAGTDASATITVKQRTGVLTVMSRAIQSDGGSTYVDKMVGGKAVKTAVRIGDVYGATTEIVSGLKAGDSVQVPGVALPAGGSGTRRGGSGGEGFSGGGYSGGGFPGGGGGGFPGGGIPGGGAVGQ